MMALETKAPDFDLPDVVTGQNVSLADFSDKNALLVMFICRHCPYVKHVEKELVEIARDYLEKGIGIVAISSNDINYDSDDSLEGLKQQSTSLGFNFPYLFDETQAVAKSYTAACTPDFFLFNKERKLVYRGQLDNSRPENKEPNDGKDLRRSIDAVLGGDRVNPEQKPSVGCNIKWKPGNEPNYHQLY